MKIKINEKILTFCGKCHKEISSGEETIIKEKVLICKECSQKTTVVCHGCSLPIFKHELFHEVSEGGNVGKEIRSTNLIQCHSCYEIGLIDARLKKILLKREAGNDKISTLSITYSLTILVFALGGEPKSIDGAKTKTFLISTSCLALLFYQGIFPLLKFILIGQEEREEKKKVEKKIKIQLQEIKRKNRKIKKKI